MRVPAESYRTDHVVVGLIALWLAVVAWASIVNGLIAGPFYVAGSFLVSHILRITTWTPLLCTAQAC
jgi:hypothetical protein